MRTFEFGPDVGKHIDRYGSDFVISRLIHTETLHVGCMHLGAGGLVGSHEAATYQLFAVVEGEGWIRTGSSDRAPIRSGQAVLWEPGELHEAGTERGMVAMVVEGDVVAANPEEIGPISGG